MSPGARISGRRLIVLLMVGVMVLSVVAPPVGVAAAGSEAEPESTSPVPAGYYGTVVDTDGDPVEEAGMEVTAELEADNEVYGPIETDATGDFGGELINESKLTVNPDSTPSEDENEVTFFVDGEPVETDEPIEWEEGASEEVTLTLDVEDDDPDPDPPNFDVTIDDTNSPITEGEELTVDLTIENTGEETDTQTITLENFDGDSVDTASVTLGEGAQETVTLTWATEAGDAGTDDITVSSDDDTATQSVEIQALPANFDVTIDDTNSPVTAGEDLVVDATIENTGGEEATQEIALTDFDGEPVDEQSVTLAGGASESITLTWSTDDTAIGSGDITVASDDDTATQEITVVDPDAAVFEVTITDAPDTVTEGDDATVEYEIENTGPATATQDITFSINGELIATNADVELDPDEVATDSFTYTTETGDAPSIDATVASDDDSDTATITVQQPAFFETTITGVEETVERGETVTVDYEINNTGDFAGAQDITFSVDDELEATDADIELDPDETHTGTFTYETDADDVPAIDLSVASDDDIDTATVDVTAPEFALDIADDLTDQSVIAGSTADVAVDIENIGTADGDETVTLFVDGTEDASETVPVTVGDTETVGFEVPTEAADAGETLDLIIEGTDDTVSTTLTVEDPPADPFFEVDITDTNSPVEAGDNATVTAEVTNVGELEGTQDVELFVRGTARDIETVDIAAGETETIELTHATGPRDTPAIDASVETANETATESIEVLTPGEFDLSIVETNTPITAGDDLNATVEIENVGDFEATDEVAVALETANATRDMGTETLTVSAGETVTEQFTVETDGADAGPALIDAASDDDDTAQRITIGAAAQFDVTIDEPAPVEAGTETTLNATIENTGDATDTQRVRLDVAGDTIAADRVELAGGETTTLTGTVTPDAAGELPVEARTADADATATLEVLQPATFDLDVSAADTVLVDETLAVTVNVTNTGDVDGTESVTLQQAGEQIDTDDVAVAPGDTETVTLAYEPTAADRGAQTLQIAGTDVTIDRAVTVDAPGEFDVALDRVTNPVVTGETLTATATVENIGDRETTETIDLSVGDDAVNTTDVTLAGGNETTVQLTHAIDAAPGEVDITVSGATASDTQAVGVLAQPDDPFFRVTDFETPDTAFTDEDVPIEATIENIGDLEGTQSIELRADGSVATSEDATLAPNETTTVTTTLSDLEAGDLEVSAVTANQTDTATIDIANRQPAFLAIDAIDTPDTVDSGDDATVTVDITNTGDQAADDRAITVSYAGTTASETVSTAAGESDTVTISVPIEEEPRAGSFDRDLTVDTGDDTETRDLMVDFGSIQSGVDVATPGDAVTVAPENYRESVTVRTAGISIIAQGAELTPRSSTGMEIRSDDVAVIGLDVDGDGAPTGLRSVSDRTTFDGVSVTDTRTGVELEGSDDSTIRRADISDVRRGVVLADADATTIRVSEIQNVRTGVEVDGDDLTVRGTTITDAERGVTLESGVENADIQRNDIFDNELGLLLRGGVGPGHQVAESNLEANDVSLRSVATGGAQTTAVTPDSDADLEGVDNWWGDADGPGEFDVRDNADNIDIIGASEEPYTDASFTVSNIQAPAEITEGEQLTVNATIDNVGDFAGADTVALQIGDETVDTAEVEIDGGDSQTVTFTYTPATDDVGDTTLGVVTSDDSETQALTIRAIEGALEFADQATGSSTITTDGSTTPGVVVEDVTATVDSALVVTTMVDGDREIVGLERLSADELDGSDQTIGLAGTPSGDHTAHVISQADLSETATVGDSLSDATAGAALDALSATVFEATLTIDDQTYDGSTDTVTVETATLVGDDETLFQVDLHETTASESPGAFVGSSAVLSGDNENVTITLEDADGEAVTFEETDEYVAMIHVVDDDDVTVGEEFAPDTFPVLPHADATDGFVAGGVTDAATVTIDDVARAFSGGGGGVSMSDPDPAFFEVTDLEPVDVTAEQGATIDVSATITNTGEEATQQTIEFRVGETVLADEDVLLRSGGGDTTVTFEDIPTDDLDAGEYTHGIYTPDDSQTGTLTIEPTDDAADDVDDTDDVDETDDADDADDIATPEDETDDGIPGFGAVVALIALLAAALLATRRQRH